MRFFAVSFCPLSIFSLRSTTLQPKSPLCFNHTDTRHINVENDSHASWKLFPGLLLRSLWYAIGTSSQHSAKNCHGGLCRIVCFTQGKLITKITNHRPSNYQTNRYNNTILTRLSYQVAGHKRTGTLLCSCWHKQTLRRSTTRWNIHCSASHSGAIQSGLLCCKFTARIQTVATQIYLCK